MKEGDRYLKIVEWSDEDQCYIGSCPELFGGGCHGNDEAKVYKELCQIVDEWIQIYKEDGIPLPEPKRQISYSGKFVVRVGPELHKVLAYRTQIANESLNNYCVGILREEAAAYDPGPPPITKKSATPRGKSRGLPRKKHQPHDSKFPTR
jgi:predicted HicB family RNase H-like nuclease